MILGKYRGKKVVVKLIGQKQSFHGTFYGVILVDGLHMLEIQIDNGVCYIMFSQIISIWFEDSKE